jgi:hypothetical protein
LPAGIRPLPCPPSSASVAVVSPQQRPLEFAGPRCLDNPRRQHRCVEHGLPTAAVVRSSQATPARRRGQPCSVALRANPKHPAAAHGQLPSETQKRHFAVK